MSKQPHKVWNVRIGSLDDEKLKDRDYQSGRRWIMVYKLPVQASYLIEAKGQGKRAETKALRLATADGINRPVMLSLELVNDPMSRFEPLWVNQ